MRVDDYTTGIRVGTDLATEISKYTTKNTLSRTYILSVHTCITKTIQVFLFVFFMPSSSFMTLSLNIYSYKMCVCLMRQQQSNTYQRKHNTLNPAITIYSIATFSYHANDQHHLFCMIKRS